MPVVSSISSTPSVATTATFRPAWKSGLSGGISQISRIALFSGASSICALESLGTEADASALRSALNGEVVWVMIFYLGCKVVLIFDECDGSFTRIHFRLL